VSTMFGLRKGDSAATPSGSDRWISALTQPLGRGMVRGMPPFLKILSTVGTLAMLWVGGGIFIHGLAQLGWLTPEHLIQAISEGITGRMPAVGGIIGWLVSATCLAIVGLVLGAAAIALRNVVAPLLNLSKT
jgi:uncharacterized protein